MSISELSEIERLYIPALYSHRNGIESMDIHMNFSVAAGDRIRLKIPSILNIEYGEREREKFDIFGTDLPDDSSIFIFVHGGFWQRMHKDLANHFVESFYRNKIKSVILGYTLCPDVTVKDIVKEIETAVKKVIAYAKQNGCKKIFLSGHSCGAHLVASLFEEFYPSLPDDEKQLLKGVVLCCGIYDLTPLVDTSNNKVLKLTFDEAKTLSPLYQNLPTLDFPVSVVIGEHDSPAFIKESELYYEKIKAVCNNSFFKILNGIDHFNIVERYGCDNYELTKFIVELNKTS